MPIAIVTIELDRLDTPLADLTGALAPHGIRVRDVRVRRTARERADDLADRLLTRLIGPKPTSPRAQESR